MFHKHNWIKIQETYAPPIFNKTDSLPPNLRFIGMFQGLTTILWECSICKKIRREEMLGKSVESKER